MPLVVNHPNSDKAVEIKDQAATGKEISGPGINDVNYSMSKKKSSRRVLVIYLLVIILGVGTGYGLSKGLMRSGVISQDVTMIKTDKVVGLNDTSTFKDSAEGVLEKGGVGEDGTHKLIREGGDSQTVALVSSVIDLDEHVGQKVRVWGQTFPPKSAGWFMDVGKIEVL